MVTRTIVAFSSAALLVGSITASAQVSVPTDKKTEFRVIGCLILEEDWRAAHGLGKGPLGGASKSDEFVLVDATQTPSSAPVVGCSEKGTGPAYRMTGHLEDKLKEYVGHRMEIIGRLEHGGDVKAANEPTSKKLPAELEIDSYREAPVMRARVSPPAPTVAPYTPAPASIDARNEPQSTPSPMPEETKALPKTASQQPLVLLIGVAFLALAVGVRTATRLS
jgi:hypothetical protein